MSDTPNMEFETCICDTIYMSSIVVQTSSDN